MSLIGSIENHMLVRFGKTKNNQEKLVKNLQKLRTKVKSSFASV